jgi:hypothetical protein
MVQIGPTATAASRRSALFSTENISFPTTNDRPWDRWAVQLWQKGEGIRLLLAHTKIVNRSELLKTVYAADSTGSLFVLSI